MNREGITISMWPPSYYVELVKDPYCFPSYGINMGDDDSGSWQPHHLRKGGGGEIGHGRQRNINLYASSFLVFLYYGIDG